MKRKHLVLCVGAPGSGKSTWIRNHLGEGDAYVSRDEVRFSIVQDDEEYFSHETAVFNEFVKQIEAKLNQGYRVFADATHISWASRRKLIQKLHDKENLNVDVYVLRTSLDTCLERNEKREGRAYVPKSVIRRMNTQMTDPANDPYNYNMIKYIFEDGKEVISFESNLANK